MQIFSLKRHYNQHMFHNTYFYVKRVFSLKTSYLLVFTLKAYSKFLFISCALKRFFNFRSRQFWTQFCFRLRDVFISSPFYFETLKKTFWYIIIRKNILVDFIIILQLYSRFTDTPKIRNELSIINWKMQYSFSFSII